MAPKIVRAIADFFFPPICLACERDSDGEILCPSCFEAIYKIERNFCQLCGQPLERSARSFLCRECKRHPLSLARIRAWARFTHPLDKVVYAFKYQRRQGLAKFFSTNLAAVLLSDPLLSSAQAIVPIPLYAVKRWWRGYNQSAVLALRLAKDSGIPLSDLLARTRPTRTQTRLSAEERRANVEGAFTVKRSADPALIKDRKLLLLDDVITSGSTLDEAAKVLIEAGASQVYGLTIGGAWIER